MTYNVFDWTLNPTLLLQFLITVDSEIFLKYQMNCTGILLIDTKFIVIMYKDEISSYMHLVEFC